MIRGCSPALLSLLTRTIRIFSIGSLLADGTCRSNSVVQRRIAHAFHNSLAQIIDFFGIIRPKCCRNGGSIVHPALQLELANHFAPVRLSATLGDLVSSDAGFIQVMHKIDRQLDQEVALNLIVIRIIQPIIKVRLGTKPKHCMRPILHPKRLFTLLHDNGAKGNSRHDEALFSNKLRFW